MTISQGLNWMKALKERHQELIHLRNENSRRSERLFGESQTVKTEPMYCVKSLDKMVSRLALEIRKLDESIKDTNAQAPIVGYEKDEAVLGELQ